MNFKKLKIEAVIIGEHSKIWEAWTNSEHITKWNFASDDWCCPSAQSDLRNGGKYKARMEAKDGSFGFDFEAVFSEVELQKKIVLNMTDGRTAATTFENMNGKTKVTTVFDAEKQNSEELQQSGWQAILDNFKKYIEEGKR